MKISVIIPAYNEEKYIGNTLESINNLDKTGLDVDILVVNGGSTDKTREIALSYGAKVLDVLHKGIGFARQQGLKKANGEIVAFTDADTTVPKNWLQKHVKALKEENVVFTYGTFRVLDGKFPYFHYINYLQPAMLWLTHHILGLPVAAGQNHAFWREKALSIGGFNEDIMVFEDIDFAIRMMKIGKVVFMHNLIVISSGRRSDEGWGFFLRMATTSFKYFVINSRNLTGFVDYR